ncbi:tyrosine-type recombinase/integrase [Haloglomus litoreum]|uniref:tyrosine-type recombinase/integrase n=1 Tax=Haloglomus litoreum TaxID=3034026 RepID=UPI0023E89684|nr:site-specific integrase [Haloglomus sp. DT116]
MSDGSDQPADSVAEAFDRSRDPLAEHEAAFDALDVDPFAMFVDEHLAERDLAASTLNTYRGVFDDWQAFMTTTVGRHPACPAPPHVEAFMTYLQQERGNHLTTVRQKLGRLNAVYEFWQDHPAFPHSQAFNPVQLVLSRNDFEPDEAEKTPPDLTLGEIRAVLQSVTQIRDRLIILLQLKLGLRASELCNIKLRDLSLHAPEAAAYYEDLGAHWALAGRPNALYIPHDRARNKSGNPRVLPLDDETRTLTRQYLRRRPTADSPYLFLAKQTNSKLAHQDVTGVWTDAFQPLYEETKRRRAVTSHYGRHRFTTFWRVEQDLPRPLVKYLRGDVPGTKSIQEKAGIDEYIHTFYEDIASRYRRDIYSLLEVQE